MLVKSTGGEDEEPVSCSNPITIMMEVSKAAYLDEILFGKSGSKERLEITSFIEQTTRMEQEDMVKFLNDHLKMRMFMIGQSITAADILVLLHVSKFFIKEEKEKDIENYMKLQNPHVFRWLDHV